MTTAPAAMCGATRKDGQPCTTTMLVDGSFCFGHSPKHAEARAEARRRGGQSKANHRRLAKLMPPRLGPVIDQLERALGDVLAGQMPPPTAHAAAALAKAMVVVLSAGELEERIRTLEGRAG